MSDFNAPQSSPTLAFRTEKKNRLLNIFRNNWIWSWSTSFRLQFLFFVRERMKQLVFKNAILSWQTYLFIWNNFLTILSNINCTQTSFFEHPMDTNEFIIKQSNFHQTSQHWTILLFVAIFQCGKWYGRYLSKKC